MTNKDLKIKKWESLKEEVLKAIPKEYSIQVEGIEDNSVYFHPFVNIESGMTIRGQADIEDNEGVYAWQIAVKQPIGNLIYSVLFNIDDLSQIKKLLTNWDDYKNIIYKYLEVTKSINETMNMLSEIKNNIECNLLNDTFTKENRQYCLDNLFKAKEWIENERIIEKYSGL